MRLYITAVPSIPTARIEPDLPTASRNDKEVDPIVAGVDTALIVSSLGIVYALIAFSPLGARALPFSLLSTTIGMAVGGLCTVLAARNPRYISGPTASGVLVVASLVRELEALPLVRDDPGAAIIGAAATVLLAGLFQIGFARLRFGSALKFVPYPVLIGFANSVTLLLILSVLPFAFGHDYPGRLVDVSHWFDGWRPASLGVAVIGTLGGIAVARWLPRAPAAFAALVAATLAYHLVPVVCGTCSLGPVLDLASVADPIGPRASSLSTVAVQGLPYWSAVLQSAAVLAILNSLFSLLGAAQVTKAHDPIVDGNRLLQALGIGNVGSALLLGMPVAGIASATLAIRRTHVWPWLAIASYLACVVLILGVGRHWLGFVPVVAVASAVFISSRNLFDPAAWSLLRLSLRPGLAARAARGPFAVSTLVVAIGLFKGLAAALFVGALAAACLLAIEMRRSVVLAVHDAVPHRSRRVRSDLDVQRLDAASDQIRIVELGHWLYFGTADALVDVFESTPNVRWLLLDMRRVAGIDLTAARSLVRSAERLGGRGIGLIAAGLAEGDARRETIEAFRDDDGRLPLTLVGTLDAALELVEDLILGTASEPPPIGSLALPGLSDVEHRRLEPWVDAVAIEAGTMLFATGDSGDALFSIRSGRMTLWVERDDGLRHRLLSFGPNGVFGELALLDRRPRSADAMADTDCSLWRLTRERLDAMAQTDHVLHAAVLNGIALHLAHRLRATTRLLDLG